MITILIVAVAANGLLVVFLVLRKPAPPDLSALLARFSEESVRLREEARVASVTLRQEVIGLFSSARTEAAENRRAHREEISRRLDSFNEALVRAVRDYGVGQRQDLESIRAQVEKVSTAVDERLKEIQASNVSELQQMRMTVDEKLQGTLNQRLGESFALVSERLELVHKGLGEMHTLAAGVGDLKKVLSNVKSRGGWGEVQLEAILEQMLSPEQYERNVVTKEVSRESVEFAVRFPGKTDVPLLLPIDAKFPVEDHQQLIEAYERGDRDSVEAASRRLDTAIKNAAKTICEKYLNPPVTTDFAIMFLPTEGLYAEVLRRPGLVEQIQRECGILIAGPTTLTAILSSLQMGFRTLAIEQRSSEVWRLLEAMKTEFGKFGRVVDKVNKNLDTARNHMDALGVRSRVVARKLREVQSLPDAEAKLLLKLKPLLPESADADSADEDSETSDEPLLQRQDDLRSHTPRDGVPSLRGEGERT